MPAIRKPKDFLSGAFFMAVGIAAIVLAQDYTIGTASRMGSGYFAALMGLILCGFGVILIGRSFFGRIEPLPGMALRGPILVLVSAVLYAALLRPVGMIGATFAIVGVSALGSPSSRPLPTLLLALGLAVGCTLAFVYGLGQPIPVLGDLFGRWAR